MLFAYDYAAGRLLSFDRQGRLRWTFGRKGRGPGEFANPLHLFVTADGAIWVTDGCAGRIAIVTGAGELREHIGFDGRPIMRLLPRDSGRLVFPIQADALWLALDANGQVIEAGLLPTQALRDADPAVRTPYVAMSSQGTTWAMAFFAANPLLSRGAQPDDSRLTAHRRLTGKLLCERLTEARVATEPIRDPGRAGNQKGWPGCETSDGRRMR